MTLNDAVENGARNERPLRIVPTTGSFYFAQEVAASLEQKYADLIPPQATTYMLPMTRTRFSDGLGMTHIGNHVRGADVYVIADVVSGRVRLPVDTEQQAYETRMTSDDIQLVDKHGNPIQSRESRGNTAEQILELASTLEALGNAVNTEASTGSITVIMPYLPGARQDRRGGRNSLDIRVTSELVKALGGQRAVSIDVHNVQAYEGNFNIPADNLLAARTAIDYLKHESDRTDRKFDLDKGLICAPDVGAIKLAQLYQKGLEVSRIGLNKERLRAGVVNGVDALIGDTSLVEGSHVIMPDDMVDTGGTLITGARHLKDLGAEWVGAFATHGLLTGKALENFDQAFQQGVIDQLYITNSIAHPAEVTNRRWLSVVEVTNYFAKVIASLHTNRSISELLEEPFSESAM